MKVSNRVKRNISLTLTIVGLLCTAARANGVAQDMASVKAWFELAGIVVMTFLCYDNFRLYRRRVRKGILFGSITEALDQAESPEAAGRE